VALEITAQKSCGCLIPGSAKGQVAWGFCLSNLVGDIPAHGRGIVTRQFLTSLPN